MMNKQGCVEILTLMNVEWSKKYEIKHGSGLRPVFFLKGLKWITLSWVSLELAGKQLFRLSKSTTLFSDEET